MNGKVLGIDLTVDPYLVEDDTDLYGSDRGAEVVEAAPAQELFDGDEGVTNADEEVNEDVEDVKGRVMPCPGNPNKSQEGQSQDGDHRAEGHTPYRSWSECV